MAEIDDALEFGPTSTNSLLSFTPYNNNEDINDDDGIDEDEDEDEDVLRGTPTNPNQGTLPISAENALLAILNLFPIIPGDYLASVMNTSPFSTTCISHQGASSTSHTC